MRLAGAPWDAHIVQLGVAVTLVLHRLGGVQSVDGVAAPRLRVGKAFGRLLDCVPQTIRQVMAQSPSLQPAIDKKHRDRGDQRPTKDQDPEAQASRRHSDSRSRSGAFLQGKARGVCEATRFLRKSAAPIFLIFSLPLSSARRPPGKL
jgi:hypothetical protein